MIKMGKRICYMCAVIVLLMLMSSCQSTLQRIQIIFNSNQEKSVNTKLQNAISDMNFEAAKEAIESGANVNEIGSDGLFSGKNIPLIESMRTGEDGDITNLLIENGADIDYQNKYGISLLMLTNEARPPKGGVVNEDIASIDNMELLIKCGADINAVDNEGYSALDHILLCGNNSVDFKRIQRIDLLMAQGINVTSETVAVIKESLGIGKGTISKYYENMIPVYNRIGTLLTAAHNKGVTIELPKLIEASIFADSAEIEKIIQNRELTSEEIILVGFFAAVNDDVVTLKSLKTAGYSLSVIEDTEENTLLHLAAECGNVDVINYLLSQNFNIDSMNLNYQHPVNLAVSNNQYDTVKLLIENNTQLTYLETEADGANNDVLCQATANNNSDLLGLLYESIKQVDDFRMYLICADAIANNNLSALKYLVKHGANMNMAYSLSLLTMACGSTNANAVDIVKYLVENGADVNDTDGSGFPLISAVKRGNVDIISYLIQNGANVNPIDSNNTIYTPLTAAILYGRFDAMKLLVENGASINSVDYGWGEKTPIDTAAECGSDRIHDYLTDIGAK